MPTVTVRWSVWRERHLDDRVRLSKRMEFDVLPRTGDSITTGWGTVRVTAVHGPQGEYTLRADPLVLQAAEVSAPLGAEDAEMTGWVEARRAEGWRLDREELVSRS